MKRLMGVVAIVMLATPLFAQDDFGGDFGGADFFGNVGGGGRGNNNSNVRFGQTFGQNNAPQTLMTRITDALERHKVPKLSKDQEKELLTWLEAENKSMYAELQKKAAELNVALATNNNNNNGGRGNNNNNTTQLYQLIREFDAQEQQKIVQLLTPLSTRAEADPLPAEKDFLPQLRSVGFEQKEAQDVYKWLGALPPSELERVLNAVKNNGNNSQTQLFQLVQSTSGAEQQRVIQVITEVSNRGEQDPLPAEATLIPQLRTAGLNQQQAQDTYRALSTISRAQLRELMTFMRDGGRGNNNNNVNTQQLQQVFTGLQVLCGSGGQPGPGMLSVVQTMNSLNQLPQGFNFNNNNNGNRGNPGNRGGGRGNRGGFPTAALGNQQNQNPACQTVIQMIAFRNNNNNNNFNNNNNNNQQNNQANNNNNQNRNNQNPPNNNPASNQNQNNANNNRNAQNNPANNNNQNRNNQNNQTNNNQNANNCAPQPVQATTNNSQNAANNTNGNNNNNNNGGRGNFNNNNNNNNNNLNSFRDRCLYRPAEDEFLVKLIDNSVFKAPQRFAMEKFRDDVHRQRGGIESFRIGMKDVGVEVMPEQMPQLQIAFQEYDQARNRLRTELEQEMPAALGLGDLSALVRRALFNNNNNNNNNNGRGNNNQNQNQNQNQALGNEQRQLDQQMAQQQLTQLIPTLKPIDENKAKAFNAAAKKKISDVDRARDSGIAVVLNKTQRDGYALYRREQIRLEAEAQKEQLLQLGIPVQ